MCLILFAQGVHPDYPLVLAANRDESYARPTAPASFWTDHPSIYAGRDLQQGGTWLGITREGRFAAVTNYRGSAGADSMRSRGELVLDYLSGQESPADYLDHISRAADTYNGFNLLFGSPAGLHFFSNRGTRSGIIEPGVHGLSNHLLDTAWPKVEHGKTRLAEFMKRRAQDLIDGLFDVLAERTLAADGELPETGVGLARERVLSPAFILSPGYGTRSSTVLLVDNKQQVTFVERRFGEGGEYSGATTATFALEVAVNPAAA
ncbi:MAG TPA: NRDE family protein [Burkholderiales bacterium]|nr:NRDE family protein [Burkholderiales bacterium]